MRYKIEGTVATVHGEEWLIVAELEGGFCLAVRNGEVAPAPIYLVYCSEILAVRKTSEVII